MKKLFIVLAIALLSFSLAQKLTVWSISVEQAELYTELETAFHEAYPNYEVEIVTMSQDQLRETLPLAYESGNAPDLLLRHGLPGDQTTLSFLLESNWVAPVTTNEAVKNTIVERFPTGTFVEGHNMKDGVIYGLPLNESDIWGHGYMYYNIDVLTEAGVDTMTEIPTTWSELLDVCAKVAAADLSCFTMSMSPASQLARWWTPFSAVAETQSRFNYQTGKFSFGDADRLRAYDLLKTLYDSEYIIPGVESTNRETSRQVFALGQAAFYVDGAWIPSVLRTGMGFPDLNFGAADIPRPDDGTQGKLSKGLLPTLYFVSSQVSSPVVATAFAEFITRPDGMYAEAYVGGGFGFASYTDNSKWIDPNDAILQQVVNIGANGHRAFEPIPRIACSPDSLASTAFNTAAKDASFPSEYEGMVEALVSGSDWHTQAVEIATGRQAIFEKLLAEEAAGGLNVNLGQYTYPSYQFGADFDYASYPKCK